MNNLLSYCGLKDSKMRASDTDLPVTKLRNSLELTVLIHMYCDSKEFLFPRSSGP